MGYRISKVYTRTGDDGTTGLGDGVRVDKDNPRIDSFGAVDELNSILGLILTEDLPDNIRIAITSIQHDLFDLGAELCIPGNTIITDQQVNRLETFLDKLNAELAPLKEFILPGGCRSSALCHLARTVCRRAERRTVCLNREQPISAVSLMYLNRLSDFLFVAARYLNKRTGENDVLWEPDQNKR